MRIGPLISFLEPKWHFSKNCQLKFCLLFIKYLFLNHNITPTGGKKNTQMAHKNGLVFLGEEKCLCHQGKESVILCSFAREVTRFLIDFTSYLVAK